MAINIKLIAFILIGLTLVNATKCHNSCICAENSNVCDSCSSEFGDYERLPEFGFRYCPCSFGYYVSQVTPTFICSPYPYDEDMDGCEMQLVGDALQLIVSTDCKAMKIDNKTYISSKVDLDRFNLIKSGGCLEQFTAQFYYRDPFQQGNPKVLIPDTIHTVGFDMTSHELLFSISDIEKYAMSQGQDKDVFWYKINVVIEIGHQRSVIRAHTYEIYANVQKDLVSTFKIDLNGNKSQGCQDGQECIIISDLDTTGKIYEDENYNKIKQTNYYSYVSYQVGDTFFAEIHFKDPTFTKKLVFESLYFLTTNNLIMDYTKLVQSTQIIGGIQIKMPIVYPTTEAVVQINMKVSDAKLRSLEVGEKSTSTQFTFSSLYEEKQYQPTKQNQASTDESYISKLFFSFTALLIFLI